VLVEPGTVRLEVEDGAGAMRIANELASDRTTGGLRIVESMAMDWVLSNEARGKRSGSGFQLSLMCPLTETRRARICSRTPVGVSD